MGGSEAQKAKKDEKDRRLFAIIKINRLATLVQMTYYVQELNEEEEGVHEFIEDEQFGTQQMSPEGNAMSIIERVDEQYQEFFFGFVISQVWKNSRGCFYHACFVLMASMPTIMHQLVTKHESVLSPPIRNALRDTLNRDR